MNNDLAGASPVERRVRPRCGDCRFWEYFDEEEDERIGTCRRYPPQRTTENPALFDANGGIPPLAHSPREWSQPTILEYQWRGR
jgi:hypothetical protein